MQFFLVIVGFCLGLLFIIKGGDWFVDSASYAAEATGIPKFIIGATIVSIATTLPELMVSSIAASCGKVDMAVGNAVGSVIANIALILSLSILFTQIIVKNRRILSTKMLLFLATVIALVLLSLQGSIGIGKSLILFALLGLYLYENLKSARQNVEANETVSKDRKTITINILKFVVGIVGIVIGSRLLVTDGSAIARRLGVSEAVISLTAISIGTSLPELVTAISAMLKKESSLSVGNIFGANVFDLALVLPVCGIISSVHDKVPLPISQIMLQRDVVMMCAVSLIATVPVLIKGRFMKWQGVVLVLAYAGYLYWLHL